MLNRLRLLTLSLCLTGCGAANNLATQPVVPCTLLDRQPFPDLAPTEVSGGVMIPDKQVQDLFVWVNDTRRWEDKAEQCLALRGALRGALKETK